MIKRIWNTEYKLVIQQDEWVESPREWNDWSKLCIREHRRSNFPNELGFSECDFENIEKIANIAKENGLTLFWLDCYEHSNIYFSLAGTGTQCRFDTSNKCGFILAESEEVAKQEIETYNSWLNWEVYEYIIEEREVIEKEWKTFYTDWEFIDSCGGFYDWESMVGQQDIFSKEEFEKAYFKY